MGRALAPLLLLSALLLVPASASARGFSLYFGGHAGGRHSYTVDTDGLDLSVDVMLNAGPLAFGLQANAHNDNSFSELSDRRYHRHMNYANLALVLKPPIPLHVIVGVGGGIGFIRDAGVANRTPSHGLHQFVQIAGGPGLSEAVGMYVGVRIEQEQLWQPDKFAGIDHATIVKGVFGIRFSPPRD